MKTFKCPCGKALNKDQRYCGACGRPKIQAVRVYPMEGVVRPQGYAKKTRHFREPKKGEYYLSGCPGFETAYKAPNDLSTKFRIMEPV